MEELLFLKYSEKRPNFVQMGNDFIKVNDIIEKILTNDYEDNSLKILKSIIEECKLIDDNKTYNYTTIQLIKENAYFLIKEGILSKESLSEYLSIPIIRIDADNYYLLRHVIDYMDLQDKKRGFSASSNEAQFIRTGRITSFDQQTGSELQELMALGDLELLKYLLHKTYDLNVKTADANQLNYQSIMIDSIISMLLDRKVITEDEFSQPNFDVSIRAKQKKYFIDKRYLARL